MRILVISQYFWPENFRVNDLVKELVCREHQVTVLTGIPNYPEGKVFDAYRDQPDAFTRYQGAQVVRVPILARGKGGLRLTLNYLSFVLGASIVGLWRLRHMNIDVIFVYEPSPVTVGLPAVWIGKFKKAPVVFWALDLWPETLAALGVVKSQMVLNGMGHMVRYIYDRCALVLGQSRSFLASIGKYCADKRKIHYFPSWAEDVLQDTPQPPAIEVPVLDKGFTILFTGNIGEAQDLNSVLAAAEKLQESSAIRWVIVGDGRKFDWLKSEVLRRGLGDRVYMPGRFPVERMPSFYAHADALLVSLKPEPVFSMTIPGKVQAYLQAGLPLIGMLDGEGAAVIQDAKAGLTCPAGDSEGLANLIRAMVAMTPQARALMGINGRRYASQEFDRTRLIDKLERILQSVVDSARYA